jgi:peptidoglycan/xylan/chitin deacetylase (PgdA/CDA1 family)
VRTLAKEWFRRFAAGYLVALPCVTPLLVLCVRHEVVGCLYILHALLFAPTFVPNGSAYGPVIRRFNTSKMEVFLTLDDGPDPAVTPRVLEILSAHHAKACFFVVGSKVRESAGLVRDMVARGHEVGNHTASHRERSFWGKLWRGVAREVDECSRAITAAAPAHVRWFRTPVGLTSPFVYPAVRARNLQVLGWSAWARDAGSRYDAEVVGRVLEAVRPGAVIVMHPEWRAPDGSFPQLACLEKVLAELGAMGYRCVIPRTETFT